MPVTRGKQQSNKQRSYPWESFTVFAAFLRSRYTTLANIQGTLELILELISAETTHHLGS